MFSGPDTIGGAAPGAGNLISGNTDAGMLLGIGGRFLVQGNLIGTDAAGLHALANGVGIILSGDDNTIGGTTANERNVISGNTNDGVDLYGSRWNQVLGNYIGVDTRNVGLLGNATGVSVSGDGNRIGAIGGVGKGGNVIAGNREDGLGISASGGNDVEGNVIAKNHGNGVSVDCACALITGNSITSNGGDGVCVESCGHATILSNSITGNAGLGIRLTQGGNNDQAAPVLSVVLPTGVNQGEVVLGSLTSTPSTTFTLQFFSDSPSGASGSAQGRTLLGSLTVQTDATGQASFSFTSLVPVAIGDVVTATATSASGDTSQFSAPAVLGLGV
jgi:parallel beta-helix repeat protein